MIYRIVITLAVLAALVVPVVLKGGDSEQPVAPAASSNPDEARFKGLTIN